MFVVDASITMAWCFEDEASDVSEAMLDRLESEQAVVPTLWLLEVANVLLVAERRSRLTEAQAERFLGLLARLPIVVDDVPPNLATINSLGRRHAISAYDADYLALAERLGVPLATLDERLATAARSAGVTVLS